MASLFLIFSICYATIGDSKCGFILREIRRVVYLCNAGFSASLLEGDTRGGRVCEDVSPDGLLGVRLEGHGGSGIRRHLVGDEHADVVLFRYLNIWYSCSNITKLFLSKKMPCKAIARLFVWCGHCTWVTTSRSQFNYGIPNWGRGKGGGGVLAYSDLVTKHLGRVAESFSSLGHKLVKKKLIAKNKKYLTFCKRDNTCASFCCLSASSPLPEKSTRKRAMMESTISNLNIPASSWNLAATKSRSSACKIKKKHFIQ